MFPENTLLRGKISDMNWISFLTSVIDLDALSSNLSTPAIQVAVPKSPVSKAATRVLPHNEKRIRAARLSIISPRSGLAGTRTRAVGGIFFLCNFG